MNTNKTNLMRTASRCYFCSELIPTGSPFQWHHKSAIRGGSRARGVASRYVPCCDGAFPGECKVKAREAEQAAQDAKLADLTSRVAAMIAAGDHEGALALLTGVRA